MRTDRESYTTTHANTYIQGSKLFLITTSSRTTSQPFSPPLNGVFTLTETEKMGTVPNDIDGGIGLGLGAV